MPRTKARTKSAVACNYHCVGTISMGATGPDYKSREAAKAKAKPLQEKAKVTKDKKDKKTKEIETDSRYFPVFVK